MGLNIKKITDKGQTNTYVIEATGKGAMLGGHKMEPGETTGEYSVKDKEMKRVGKNISVYVAPGAKLEVKDVRKPKDAEYGPSTLVEGHLPTNTQITDQSQVTISGDARIKNSKISKSAVNIVSRQQANDAMIDGSELNGVNVINEDKHNIIRDSEILESNVTDGAVIASRVNNMMVDGSNINHSEIWENQMQHGSVKNSQIYGSSITDSADEEMPVYPIEINDSEVTNSSFVNQDIQDDDNLRTSVEIDHSKLTNVHGQGEVSIGDSEMKLHNDKPVLVSNARISDMIAKGKHAIAVGFVSPEAGSTEDIKRVDISRDNPERISYLSPTAAPKVLNAKMNGAQAGDFINVDDQDLSAFQAKNPEAKSALDISSQNIDAISESLGAIEDEANAQHMMSGLTDSDLSLDQDKGLEQ